MAKVANTKPKEIKENRTENIKEPNNNSNNLKTVKSKSTHPPVSQMVNNAIKNLNERNGSSLVAIKKYLAANYEIDPGKFAPFIKKYLKNSVADGKLIQTTGKGASGSFKLQSGKAKKPKRDKGKMTKSKKEQSASDGKSEAMHTEKKIGKRNNIDDNNKNNVEKKEIEQKAEEDKDDFDNNGKKKKTERKQIKKTTKTKNNDSNNEDSESKKIERKIVDRKTKKKNDDDREISDQKKKTERKKVEKTAEEKNNHDRDNDNERKKTEKKKIERKKSAARIAPFGNIKTNLLPRIKTSTPRGKPKKEPAKKFPKNPNSENVLLSLEKTTTEKKVLKNK